MEGELGWTHRRRKQPQLHGSHGKGRKKVREGGREGGKKEAETYHILLVDLIAAV